MVAQRKKNIKTSQKYEKHPYAKREFSENKVITTHKKDINKFFSNQILKKVLEKGKILVVDSIKEGSRTNLLQSGFENSEIITVDKNCEKTGSLYNKTTLCEYATKCVEKEFKGIFADVIASPKNSIIEIKPFFERRLLINDSILAVTFCLRNCSPLQFGRFHPEITKLGKRNNYDCVPINLTDNYRIPTKKKSKFNIKKNMTDNGANKKTGRTVTAFYNIKKLN